MRTFTATLGETEAGSVALVELPFDPRAVFGKARAPVTVTVRGVVLRTTVATYGGRAYIGLRREIRERAKLVSGTRLRIQIEADDAPRVVEVPPDLAKALKANPAARAAWAALSFTHQREHAQALDGAKRPATRAARLEKTLASLRAEREKTPRTRGSTGVAKAHTSTPAALPAEPPTLAFPAPEALEAWLSSHHASSTGTWIALAKKGSGIPSVTYGEAVLLALAWGWIDGQRKALDDSRWVQRFTPRAPRSIWSQINRENALALIAAGKMAPPGLAEVERAKKDGRWAAAYEAQSKATVPPDLAAALAENPAAAAFFATLGKQNRYAVLFRVHTAKKPETRARRVATFVEIRAGRDAAPFIGRAHEPHRFAQRPGRLRPRTRGG